MLIYFTFGKYLRLLSWKHRWQDEATLVAGLKEAINEDTKAQAEPHTVYVMCKHRQLQNASS